MATWARLAANSSAKRAPETTRQPNRPAAMAVLAGGKRGVGRGLRLGLWLAVWAPVAIGWTSSSSGAPPNWPASLTIGTASPGGVYYVYGQGLAAILTEALGIPVSALATQGPEQNILLLESGDAQVGFVTMGV